MLHRASLEIRVASGHKGRSRRIIEAFVRRHDLKKARMTAEPIINVPTQMTTHFRTRWSCARPRSTHAAQRASKSGSARTTGDG